ncbi:hypothetical protein E1301_Tti022505 [Triplophysa tibetana]|uniref:Uncharacterized protein n=2 Tax=Triplophysa tibetana TaxID=1572043 RepID=A0A5A9N7V7_9TELE|nr:hypothetical protein E1301_Tti022505 [Triplophysa tibetana]
MIIFTQETYYSTIVLAVKVNALLVTMSSYWAKRRRILKGVERDKQEIAAAYEALLAVIPDFDQVNPPVNDHQHGMATTSHVQTVTPEAQEINVDEVYEPGEIFSSSTEDSEEEEDCLRTQLAGWAIDNMIPHVALGKLLTILSKDHPTLPPWPPFNLRRKDKGNNLAIRCTPAHSTWEKHNFKFMKGAESWQEAMRYLVRFQTGSSVETTDDDKKRKRKRITNLKYRPQASSDEEESSLPDAPAAPAFRQPLLNCGNIVPGNEVSVLPDAPEVAPIPENQENVEPSVDFRTEQRVSPVIKTPLHRAKSLSSRHLAGYSPQQFLDERCRARQVLSFTPPSANLSWQHMGENPGGESHPSVSGPWTPLASRVQHEVFSYEDSQRLQNDNNALREDNKALREDNKALREESTAMREEIKAMREEIKAMRESNTQAASDDGGSLQEQVTQVAAMLKTFARTGQSGADQTLMLRRLGEFGDVQRNMDNKMDTMLQHFSANMSVGELSLPGDLLLPLDTQEDLTLLDNNLRQDKELQERFVSVLLSFITP